MTSVMNDIRGEERNQDKLETSKESEAERNRKSIEFDQTLSKTGKSKWMLNRFVTSSQCIEHNILFSAENQSSNPINFSPNLRIHGEASAAHRQLCPIRRFQYAPKRRQPRSQLIQGFRRRGKEGRSCRKQTINEMHERQTGKRGTLKKEHGVSLCFQKNKTKKCTIAYAEGRR